jgi:hypothetical protein
MYISILRSIINCVLNLSKKKKNHVNIFHKILIIYMHELRNKFFFEQSKMRYIYIITRKSRPLRTRCAKERYISLQENPGKQEQE